MDIQVKTGLIVDLQSLEAMSSHHVVQVHYGRLLERLIRDRQLVRAAVYGAVDHDDPSSEQRLGRIAGEGFKVVSKSLRRRADGVRRASLNVNVAVDALELAPNIDVLTLVTADADFVPLVEAVQRCGVRVEVVMSGELAPSGLAEVADVVIDFSALLADVRRPSERSRALPRERGRSRARIEGPTRHSSSHPESVDRDVRIGEAERTKREERGRSEPEREPQAPALNESGHRTRLKVMPEEKLSGRALSRRPDED